MCVVNWPFADAEFMKVSMPFAGLIEYALTRPAKSSLTEYSRVFAGFSARYDGFDAVTTCTSVSAPSCGFILNTEMPTAELGCVPPGGTSGAV